MLAFFYYHKDIEYHAKERFKISRNSETSKIDSHWTDAALLRLGKTASLDNKMIPVTVRKIPDDISWWSWKGGPPTRK